MPSITESVHGLRNVLWAFTVIASGGLMYGYCIGINSNIVTQGQLLCEDGYRGEVGTWLSSGYGQCYQLSGLAVGLLSSMNLIGACVSSLICFRYADVLGRKLEVQIAGALYCVGGGIAAASPQLLGVYAGFLIYGLGIGFAMHAAPVYIAEISPPDVRGRLVSAKEALIVLGMVLGFLAGYLYSGVHTTGWRLMVASSCWLALFMLLGIAGVPQSPRFLLLQAARGRGSRDEASAALQFFRRASEAEVAGELRTIAEDVAAALAVEDVEGERAGLLTGTAEARKPGLLDAFRYRRPMVVGCGLVLLQQITGQPSVLYFATVIFKQAGFGTTSSLCSLVVGVVKLVATLFTVWQIDRYGRRPLLFAGTLMMAAALLTIAVAFRQLTCGTPGASVYSCNQDLLALPSGWDLPTIVALMLYVSGYQVGFGPIGWLMISEVFPLEVRGSALSVAVLVNFVSNMCVTIAQPALMESMAPMGLFFVYFCLTLLSIVFIAFMVPETKGLSLEQIQGLMKS